MFFSTYLTTHASFHVSVISFLLLNLMYRFLLLGKENPIRPVLEIIPNIRRNRNGIINCHCDTIFRTQIQSDKVQSQCIRAIDGFRSE